MKGSSTLPYTTMTLSFPKLSPSSETISSSTNCLPTLLHHIYLYRSQRPSTFPCLLPAPLCLSCWWTEDSTDSWGHSPETTSPTFSKQFSSPAQRSSTALTMVVTRWRRRFRSNRRMGYYLLNLLTPAPLDPQGLPPLPTLSPRLTLPSTLLPNWLKEPIPSPVAQGLHLPFPQGNNIIMTLH